MKRRLFTLELLLALRLGAVGEWWAASALRRLGKLSGEHSEEQS